MRLTVIAHALDPVQLLRQIEQLQDALWRHARSGTIVRAPVAADPAESGISSVCVTFEAAAAGGAVDTTRQFDTREGRKYRRTKHRQGPRLYRTRDDPFATVWQEIEQELTARPDRTAKALFADLQHRYPGEFPATQLRTLQRRVKEWRVRAILAFDDRWLAEEMLVKQSLPLPLRAIVAQEMCDGSGKIGDEATVAAG